MHDFIYITKAEAKPVRDELYEIIREVFKYLENKINWLKANGYWGELQDYYIDKKNCNNNPDKHSRSILAESINEMYQKMINCQ